MKITLRKASVLQNEIQEAIKKITLTGRVSLNEFRDPAVALAEANAELMTKLEKVTKLGSALAKIRAQIGAANVNTGVNERLAELASVDKMITRYTELVDESNVAEDTIVIVGRIAKLVATPATAYYTEQKVDTGVLSAADMNLFNDTLRDLRKYKQRMNDEMLDANIRTEIELSQSVVDILTDEKLI